MEKQKTHQTVVNLALTNEERKWLKEEAERQQRSVANLIKYILHCYKTNQ